MADSNELTLNDAIPYIKNNINIQNKFVKDDKPCPVIFISGAPGIGKSDLLTQIAEELHMGLNPQYLGTMLVEQFGMPLPMLDTKSDFQKWSQPDFFSVDNLRVKPKVGVPCSKMTVGTHSLDRKIPTTAWEPCEDGPVILFMDDLHLATKTIQTYFFQLLTYRSIHNKKMPDNFVMVAAGNRSIDRAGAQPIMAPIVNRFYFVDVKATADDWLKNFAIPKQLRQDVISFIEFYPDLLQSEPLESKPWASPRSWTYFSDSMNEYEINGKELNVSEIITLGRGHIGQDYTTKFVEYVKLFSQWDPESYLTGRLPLPDIKTLTKIECYTFMSSIVAGLLKNLRSSDFNLKDDSLMKQVNIVKKIFDLLADHCKEIIPLGMRTLIVSETVSTNQALLYYKLVENNDKLVDMTKKMLNLN